MPALMVEFGQSVTAIQLVEAVDRLARWSRHVAAATSAFDVVLSPTMAIPPPELGTLSGDNQLADMAPGLSGMTSFAIPFDVSGQPAISLPLVVGPERAAPRSAARGAVRPGGCALPSGVPAGGGAAMGGSPSRSGLGDLDVSPGHEGGDVRAEVPIVQLNNGVGIPQLGLGVLLMKPGGDDRGGGGGAVDGVSPYRHRAGLRKRKRGGACHRPVRAGPRGRLRDQQAQEQQDRIRRRSATDSSRRWPRWGQIASICF